MAPSAPEPYPSGIVTLVFTDIEGSSALGEQFGAGFETAREEHSRLLREVAAQHHGIEVKTIGDAFFLVFNRASDAVQFAIEAQLALGRYDWEALLPGTGPLRIRIGLHTGEAHLKQHPDGAYDYFGPAVNRAARMEAAAHGGQIVVSNTTYELAQARSLPEVAFDDLGLHRLKGVGEEHLWQVHHPGLETSFPPLRTLSPERHNLPLPPTPYVGHGDDIKAWSAILQSPATRLVTLHGFGGIGKTRTALQLGELAIDDFADGVWWVPLHNVSSGEEMIQRIAEQLRVHLQPQPTVREQVWNFHRDRQLLLILDNLEQIRGDEAAEVVAGLLQAGPRVKIIVTTRRSLNLAAEHLVELAPLPATEAEALFLDRARSRKAGFELNAQNAADITAICASLDGLPLAIEIAASLIVLLTPRQILKRLDDQLSVLIARDPGLPRRQQALRAAIDWSYSLLSDDARGVFAQLAAFAGGFTLEAAESVCRAGDVIGSVLELRTNSLLRAQTEAATQQERMQMLEAVREYALEKLTADEDVRRRHAAYYLEFARARNACLRTREEAAALCELEVEFDNLRAAVEWAADNHQPELCAQLAIELHQPLHLRGLWGAARQRLQTAYGVMGALDGGVAADSGPAAAPLLKALRAQLEFHLASLAHDMGDHATAQQHAEASLTRHCDINDAAGIARTLNLLGVLSVDQGDLDAAQGFYEEALQLWPDDNGAVRARTLLNLAVIAQQRGDKAQAQRLLEESLVHRRKAGDMRGEATTLGNLGVLAWERNDHTAARGLYEQSLRLHQTLREPLGIAVMLNNLGEVAQAESDLKRAVVLLVHAERIFRDLQSPLAATAARALRDIEAQQTPAAYAELRREVEHIAWEEVV